MRFERISLNQSASRPEEAATVLERALTRSVVVHIVDADRFAEPLTYWENVIRHMGSLASVGEDPLGKQLEEKNIWMDVRFDPRHQQSFRHFNSAQPLHTDGAYAEEYPGTAFFFCAQQAPAGGATLFLDVEDLVAVLEAEHPELRRTLMTLPVQFSKLGREGKTCAIIDQDEEGWRVNWNYYRVTPGQDKKVDQLRDAFHAFLQERFVATNDLLPLRLETGEAVFFKDTRVLHGRHAYEAQVAGDRLLWKCYFDQARISSSAT